MKLNTIYSKMKAFTLAEVLLVVAIIGITAAIALPNLSQNVDEDKYIMLTKTTYNELDSGFARMLANKSLEEIIDDAGATTSAAKAKAIVDELSKYIKMGTNCGNEITKCHNSSKNMLNMMVVQLRIKHSENHSLMLLPHLHYLLERWLLYIQVMYLMFTLM